jgi:hypothetical protein
MKIQTTPSGDCTNLINTSCLDDMRRMADNPMVSAMFENPEFMQMLLQMDPRMNAMVKYIVFSYVMSYITLWICIRRNEILS